MPLLFDEADGIYRIPGTYYLPPTNFTTEEALAVMILCYEFARKDRVPFYDAAHSAALKLESSLPAPVRERLRQTTANITMKLPPGNPLTGQQPVYQSLLACIGSRRAVRILYNSFYEGGQIRLKLSPYRLLYSRRSWYVIGRSSLHREVRTFNVGRILSMTLIDEVFHLPRTFNFERYLGNAWHMIPEPGSDQEVVVRFSSKVAGNVAEVLWHKTQRVVQRDDGRIDFHVRVSGLEEMSWWILGYGKEAEVIEPPAMRDIIVKHIKGFKKMYNVRDKDVFDLA